MNRSQIIALFDQDQRKDVEYPGMRREVTPTVVRHIDTSGTGEGIITYSQLNEANAEHTIREQVSYFESIGQDFEWKLYDYDKPSDLKERLGFDFVHANVLEVKDGVLTGRVLGEIVDASRKAQIVNQASCDLGILLDQIVVVGDGANDALMLGQAGLSIAYNAKKALDRVASAALGKSRLTNIFHLLGITEEDIAEALSCKPQ